VTAPNRRDLSELAALFLRLGATSFGGPVAHIAMIRQEVVARRRWLTDEEFLDLVAAVNLIPGPNSTELAIHIGLRRGGWQGLLVAGACFILPAAIIVALAGAAYTRYGNLPETGWLLYGVHPVVIGIVTVAIAQLASTLIKRPASALIAVTAGLLAFMGANELLLLAAGALAALAISAGRRALSAPLWLAAAAGGELVAQAAAASAQFPLTLTRLTLFFLKVGSVLFGSGYVLLAFLRADLVERWGWLTDRQLVDAISIGQVTPGPVFTTATFIGWVLAGWKGAILATLGIFLPAFFFVAVSHPLLPRLRQSTVAARMLDGLVAASLGLMAVVTYQLARTAIVDWTTAAMAAITILTVRRGLNSAWLIIAGAAIGWLLKGAGGG
jgi:chromate transporter